MRFVPRAMRFGTSRNQLGGDPRQIPRRAPNVRGLRDDAIESSNRQMLLYFGGSCGGWSCDGGVVASGCVEGGGVASGDVVVSGFVVVSGCAGGSGVDGGTVGGWGGGAGSRSISGYGRFFFPPVNLNTIPVWKR